MPAAHGVLALTLRPYWREDLSFWYVQAGSQLRFDQGSSLLPFAMTMDDWTMYWIELPASDMSLQLLTFVLS